MGHEGGPLWQLPRYCGLLINIRYERRFQQIIGNSPALEAVLERVERVATTGSTVLIQGETGTGKELIAHAIHNISSRCGRPFVRLNCAAIPLDLLESELFGHEKGRIHRSHRAKDWPFRARRQRYTFPGRDRRYSAGTAAQTAARIAGTGIRAPGQHSDSQS